MLEKLFGSRVRAKLLTQLFSFTDRAFYIRELQELLGEDSTNISRELKKLENIGLIIGYNQGKMRYYQANPHSAIFTELKNLILKTSGLAGILKAALEKIQGIQLAFIYGSIAQGTERSDSDVDVIIVGKVDVDHLNDTISLVEDQLQRDINYILYTPDEFCQKISQQNGFVTEILKDKKIVLFGDASRFGLS